MRVNWTKVFGVVLIASSLVAGWFAIQTEVNQDRFITCLTGRLEARQDYADADRVALKLAFTEVANARTREESLAAINRYVTAVNSTDRLREETPIPTSLEACD